MDWLAGDPLRGRADTRAVSAAEILQPQAVSCHDHAGVASRDTWMAEHQIVARRTANEHDAGWRGGRQLGLIRRINQWRVHG